MNMRFSTEAANADVMGEDTPDAGDGRPRDRADLNTQAQARARPPRDGDGDAKPGKDQDTAKP
ncbi:MAG TPA: hypothetical protein VKP68_04610 [Ramlibacter sp.]|nr:hypothetical protein [Ramlibacter sp.]